MSGTTTIEFSWDAWVSKLDPDHDDRSSVEVEYEFSARGLPIEPTGDTRLYERGFRVFRGNYRTRGAYADDE